MTELEIARDVAGVLKELRLDGVCTDVEDDVTVDTPATPGMLVEFPSCLDFASFKRHRLCK